MRRVLARKYRPKILKDLIGQDELVRALVRGIQDRRIPQAILLHGIRGTGKTSTARILARSINCVGKDGTGDMTITPCCVCRSCCAIESDSHVDVMEMDAASHTGVDDVREVIDSARYKAVLGRYKVFIIDEIHMLSKSAFNALLKTLEEPPEHVLFIFATTEINKIPETILSRCARFDLKRVSSKMLISHLKNIAEQEGYAIENDACALIARSADGSVRDSLTLLDQAMNLVDAGGSGEAGNVGENWDAGGSGEAGKAGDTEEVVAAGNTEEVETAGENGLLSKSSAAASTLITTSIIQGMLGGADRQAVFNVLSHIIDRNEVELIGEVRRLLASGADPQTIMQDLLEALYHAICFKIIPQMTADESIPEAERERAWGIAKNMDKMQLLSLWKVLLKSWADIKSAPFANQALEVGLMRACFAAGLPSIDELLAEADKLQAIPVMQPVRRNSLDAGATHQQRPVQEADSPTIVATECTIEPDSPSTPPLAAITAEFDQAPNSLPPPLAAEQDQALDSPIPPHLATIATEQDLLLSLEQDREALLLGYVNKDFAFTKFEDSNICVHIKNKKSAKAIPMLKKFLFSKTGKHWTITEVSDDNAKTNEEKWCDFIEAEKQRILETPLVQQIEQLFPNTTFRFKENVS